MAAPRLVAQLGLDAKEFQREVRSNKRYLKGVERDFTAIGTGLTAGLTVPLVGVAVAGVKASIDLSTGMANVASLIPGARDRVEELKGSVQTLAVETGTSTQDLTAGLYQTISAFGDTAESADRLGIAAKTAKAGAAGVGPTVSLLSAATKAYGDTSAAAVQRVADLSLATVRYGETDLPQLASNMGKVLPLSAALNVSQEELFATIATGTGPLGQTAEVTTQVKAALTAMLKPSKDMKAAYDDLGVASGKQLIESHGLVGAFGLLSDAAGGSEEKLGKMFGSSEALNVVLGLSGAQSDAFAEKLDALQDSSGAVNAAFLEKTEGVNAVGFQMEQARERAMVLAQNLGDVLVPVLGRVLTAAEPMVAKLEAAVTWFSNLPAPVQNTALGFAAAAAAAGPLLLIVGKMAGVLGTLAGPLTLGVKLVGQLASGTKLVALAIGIVTSPLALLATGVGVVVGAIGALLVSTKEGRELLGNLGYLVSEVLTAAWYALREELYATVDIARNVYVALVDMVPDSVLTAIEWLSGKVKGVADSFAAANAESARYSHRTTEFVGPVAVAVEAVDSLSESVSEAAESAGALASGEDAVGAGAEDAEPPVGALASGVATLKTEFQQAKEKGDEFLSTVQAIPVYAGQAVNSIGALGALGGNFLREEGGKLGGTFGAAFDAGFLVGVDGLQSTTIPEVVGGISTLPAWEASGFGGGTSLLDGVGDAFNGGSLSKLLTDAFTGGGDWAGAAKGLGAQVGGTIAENLSSALSSKLSGLFGGGGGMLGGIIGAGLSSAVTMGMSIAIPFAVKGFKKLWGLFKKPSDAELAGRQHVNDYFATLREGLSESQIQEAVGAGWEDVDLAKSWIGLRDAVMAAGGSAEQAEGYWKRLVDAIEQGPEAVAAVQSEIQEFTGAAVEAQQEIAAAAEEAARVAEEAADRMSATAVSAYRNAQEEGERSHQAVKAAAIEAGKTEEEAVKRGEQARKNAIARTLAAEREKLVQTAKFEAALAEIRAGNAEGAAAAAEKAASETRQAWNIAIAHVQEADSVATGEIKSRSKDKADHEKAQLDAVTAAHAEELDERLGKLAEHEGEEKASRGRRQEDLQAKLSEAAQAEQEALDARLEALGFEEGERKAFGERVRDANDERLAEIAAAWETTKEELIATADSTAVGINAELSSIKDVQATVSYRYQQVGPSPQLDFQSRVPSGGGRYKPPGFATGTYGNYPDFGSGTLVELHGRERITPLAEGRAEAARLDVLADRIDRQTTLLRRLVEEMPDTIGRRFREAAAEVLA